MIQLNDLEFNSITDIINSDRFKNYIRKVYVKENKSDGKH